MIKYEYIRDSLRTGDVVLFSGRGLFSRFIQLITRCWMSHIGTVIVKPDGVYLYESTTLNKGKNGVQESLLSVRVANYNGKVYVRRLKLNKYTLDEQVLIDTRKEFKDRPYEKSKKELLFSALDLTGIFTNKKKLASLFCSELLAELWQRWGLLPKKPPSNEYTPKDFTSKGTVGKLMKHGFLNKIIQVV